MGAGAARFLTCLKASGGRLDEFAREEVAIAEIEIGVAVELPVDCQIDLAADRMGAPPRDWIELGETGAIKELVKLGLGISIMARWIVREELEEKSLAYLPLPGAKLRRTWCVAALAVCAWGRHCCG